MFGKILTALFTGGIPIFQEVDAAISAYKADKNNMAKAKTVADAIVKVIDTLITLGL